VCHVASLWPLSLARARGRKRASQARPISISGADGFLETIAIVDFSHPPGVVRVGAEIGQQGIGAHILRSGWYGRQLCRERVDLIAGKNR
jgi:hypothetical protein